MRIFFASIGIFANVLTGPILADGVAAEQPVKPTIRPAASLPETRPTMRPEELVLAQMQISASSKQFSLWVKGFRKRALAKRIKASVFDLAFEQVKYNADIIDKDRNQPEFAKQIWEYLDSAASPVRVRNGKAALRKYHGLLNKIEARYGVEKEVITAIWGLESAYGAHRGKTDVVEALATLAFDGRRGKFFESQLLAALKILQSGDVDPRDMKGSWAGAMGHTQFIPTSYLSLAQDFNGDGKRDIWSDDPTDALASTAAYLAKFGWQKGLPWGVEVTLPKDFNFALASRKIRKNPATWQTMGVQAARGGKVPNHGLASILLPAGANGAVFMIFNNFSVIERYNKADAYVIGVGHLSDRLSGGPKIKASWPRDYQPLSFKQKKEMQRHLVRKGFSRDTVDGLIGPNTMAAIRKYQASIGLAPDGFPSQALLKMLRK